MAGYNPTSVSNDFMTSYQPHDSGLYNSHSPHMDTYSAPNQYSISSPEEYTTLRLNSFSGTEYDSSNHQMPQPQYTHEPMYPQKNPVTQIPVTPQMPTNGTYPRQDMSKQWLSGQGIMGNVEEYVRNTMTSPYGASNDFPMGSPDVVGCSSASPSGSTSSYPASDINFEPFVEPTLNLEEINESNSSSSFEPVKSPTADRPKRKRSSKVDSTFPKVCGVCGDSAKSMHFGGMACDSCKAFFRRSVQTKSFESFRCSAESKCTITMDTRKTCQHCRFQKCLSIGMEVRWVMPESERMAQWKSKLARHRQTDNSGPPLKTLKFSSGRSSSERTSPLSSKDTDVLRHITILQEVVFSSIPYPTKCTSAEDLSIIFFSICQKLQKFFYRIEEFHDIIVEDQAFVMKNGIAAAIYMHGVYLYDVENQRWPAEEVKPHLKVPSIKTSILLQFTVFPEIFNTVMTFYSKYGHAIKDDTVLALLCIIGLFLASHSGRKSHKRICEIRNSYIGLLKRYLLDKHGPVEGSKKFPFLLNSFEYVKRIVAYHNKVAIQPNIKRSENVSCNDISFTEQLTVIIEGLKRAKLSGMPKFSSVLEPIPPNEYGQEYQLIQSPSPSPAYSWLTSVILGAETRTDRLLSFAHPEVLVQKKQWAQRQIQHPATSNHASLMYEQNSYNETGPVLIREITSDEEHYPDSSQSSSNSVRYGVNSVCP